MAGYSTAVPLGTKSGSTPNLRSHAVYEANGSEQVDVCVQADLAAEVVSSYDSDDELIMGRRQRGGLLWGTAMPSGGVGGVRPSSSSLFFRSGKNPGSGIRSSTPVYSREDIREQYCINSKELEVLDKARRNKLFGCLSGYQEDSGASPCSRGSILSSCYGRKKVPSDESLSSSGGGCHHHHHYILPKVAPPAPRPRPRIVQGWPPAAGSETSSSQPEESEAGFEQFLQRRPRVTATSGEPKRYTWAAESAYRAPPPNTDPNVVYYPPPPSQAQNGETGDGPPQRQQKHVSFDPGSLMRSQTALSFDENQRKIAETLVAKATSDITPSARSQERLIDGRKTPEYLASDQRMLMDSEMARSLMQEKLKKACMRTQATQTEVCLGRKPIPPTYLSLSPRTAHRVRMVSQGAQTNGSEAKHRKLLKSLSEAGMMGRYHVQVWNLDDANSSGRTKSTEEFHVISSTKHKVPSRKLQGGFEDESREVFVDFGPSDVKENASKPRKILQKTLSDGEILLERRRAQSLASGYVEVDLNAENSVRSQSEDTIERYRVRDEEDNIDEGTAPEEGWFQRTGTGLFHMRSGSSASPGPGDDFPEDEFHENLIYKSGFLRKRSLSLEEPLSTIAANDVTPPPPQQMLLFTSDSEVNDARKPEDNNSKPMGRSPLGSEHGDQSSDLWSESQITVLHRVFGSVIVGRPSTSTTTPTSTMGALSTTMSAIGTPSSGLMMYSDSDSGTHVGSVSDLSSSTGATTPSAKRKMQLMHQKSSVESEVLQEEQIEGQQGFNNVTRVSSVASLNVAPPSVSTSQMRRTDSGSVVVTVKPKFYRRSPLPPSRTTSDLSETSEDYATATDTTAMVTARSEATSSSSKQCVTSSFESASSHFSGSITRGDTCTEVLVEEQDIKQQQTRGQLTREESVGTNVTSATLTPQTTRTSTSECDDSSSSGSYTVDGSSVDGVPAGGVATPTWSEEERRKIKRQLKLDFPADGDKGGKSKSSSSRRSASRSKSPSSKARPLKGHGAAVAEPITPGMVRSPAMHEGFRMEEWVIERTPVHTPEKRLDDADDADEDDDDHRKPTFEEKISPVVVMKRERRTRRSKSGSRIATKSEDPLTGNKDISPSIKVQRRRSSAAAAINVEPIKPQSVPQQSLLPLPPGSGGLQQPQPALSCESLRSVSPGSDSVFFSDAIDKSDRSAGLVIGADSIVCTHCGEVVAAEEECIVSGRATGTDEFVKPPAGFADSPELPKAPPMICESGESRRSSRRRDKKTRDTEDAAAMATGGIETATSLSHHQQHFKKNERRMRSEEREFPSHTITAAVEQRKWKKERAEGVRAKSEERSKEEVVTETRPQARSTGASLESLAPSAEGKPRSRSDASTQSSMRSSLHDLFADEHDESGVYAESYRAYTWIYIGESDELLVWRKKPSSVSGKSSDDDDDTTTHESVTRTVSGESTGSEKEFRRKYQAVTHRMVHRKSSVEMYKRLANNEFESNKRIEVQRQSGEFGFRIHGSRPVVVSAIEPETPAESSGLEVGDIIVTINGVDVLDASHSEVVKIAHAGADLLQLEVARTCDVLTPVVDDETRNAPLCAGYLWKMHGTSSSSASASDDMGASSASVKWFRRWFCLKPDYCLYYYKNDSESQPVGAVMLVNYKVTQLSASPTMRPFSFSLTKSGSPSLILSAETEEAVTRWASLLNQATDACTQADQWLELSWKQLRLCPSAFPHPDCFGFLMKLGRRWKTWKRRYCLLKDACIYFYEEADSDSAIGVAHLHGYRVQSSNVGGKKYAFEATPPDAKFRHFYFYAESETDKKRWLAALEYSIDRWIKVG